MRGGGGGGGLNEVVVEEAESEAEAKGENRVVALETGVISELLTVTVLSLLMPMGCRIAPDVVKI